MTFTLQELLTNSLFVSGVISILAVYLWQCLKEERRMGKMLGSVPGPKRVRFIGNALDLLKPREEFLRTMGLWYKIHGSRFMVKVGPLWRLVLANSKDLETILKSQTELTKSVEYKRIFRWLGLGLLTSSGERWNKRRKMITPTFHFKILEEFVDVFNNQSCILVDILKKECCNEQVFDISPYISRCTLDIICETAMGTKVNAQTDRDSLYIRAIERMMILQIHRSFRPWLFPEVIWRISTYGREETQLLKTLHGFTNKVIKERKYELESLADITTESPKAKKRKLAFLDLLIEAQKIPSNNLTDGDIREETDTFMFEGHDTTSASANFTIFLLASHPKVQKKVQQELSEIFRNDSTRPITTQDISEMKYLECCIKESLRLYPSVPIVGRTLQNDMQFDDKLTVPKGTSLVLCLYLLHRNPEVFPEPEKYIPERFLPENSNDRDPFSYLPFVAGPRNCIGQKFAMMEEKIIIASLLRNFTIEAAQRHEDLIVSSDLIIRCHSGIQIKLKPKD